MKYPFFLFLSFLLASCFNSSQEGAKQEEASSVAMPSVPTREELSNRKDISVYTDSKEEIEKIAVFEKKFTKQQLRQSHFLFVQELFSLFLKRSPTSKEAQNILSNLDQGGTREGVFRSVLYGDEFYQMEDSARAFSQESLAVLSDLLRTVFQAEVKEEVLEKMSFKTLLRFFTERALSLLEFWEQDMEKAYEWYAHLSSSLAKKVVFAEEGPAHRREVSLEKQYAMAKLLPMDLLRSEIIIKLAIFVHSLH